MIRERMVRRFYVNGKGYASRAAALYQLAKRELLDEFLAHGPFVAKDGGKGPAYHAMTDKYKTTRCRTCNGTGFFVGLRCGRCYEGQADEYFDVDAWHTDIRNRAAKIAMRDG